MWYVLTRDNKPIPSTPIIKKILDFHHCSNFLFVCYIWHRLGAGFFYQCWHSESRLVRVSGCFLRLTQLAFLSFYQNFNIGSDLVRFSFYRHILLYLHMVSWLQVLKLTPTCGEFRYGVCALNLFWALLVTYSLVYIFHYSCRIHVVSLFLDVCVYMSRWMTCPP